MKALRFNVNVPRFIAAKAAGALLGDRVFYSGPLSSVKLVEAPEPGLPGADWAIIKTYCCGFCGSDLNLILYRESPTGSPFTSFPCIIGHELCGEIVERGGGVKGFSRGDYVTFSPPLGCGARNITPECPSCRRGMPGNCENLAEGNLAPGMFTGICSEAGGGFAPYLAVHRSQLFRLYDSISPRAGSMTEPFSVAMQAVMGNIPQRDEHVLVIGAGVIGNLVVRSVRALGVRCAVSVMEPSSFHAGLAADAGADNLITGGDPYAQAARITGAKLYKPMLGDPVLTGGFHRIFDTVGSSATVTMALRILAAHGTLSLVGISNTVKMDVLPLFLKQQTIKGSFAYGTVAYKGKKRHVFEMVIDLMRSKRVNMEAMVTHSFRLEDYREMIRVNLDKKKFQAVKTVVSFVE